MFSIRLRRWMDSHWMKYLFECLVHTVYYIHQSLSWWDAARDATETLLIAGWTIDCISLLVLAWMSSRRIALRTNATTPTPSSLLNSVFGVLDASSSTYTATYHEMCTVHCVSKYPFMCTYYTKYHYQNKLKILRDTRPSTTYWFISISTLLIYSDEKKKERPPTSRSIFSTKTTVAKCWRSKERVKQPTW